MSYDPAPHVTKWRFGLFFVAGMAVLAWLFIFGAEHGL